MNRLSFPKNSISFIVEWVKASLPTTPFHPHVFRPTRISAIFPPKANSWQSRLPLRSRSGLEEAGAENSPLAPLCSIISDTKEIERTHEMMLRYPPSPIIPSGYCSGPKWVKGCLLEGQKMNTENNNPYQTSASTNPPALPREGHSKLGITS